MKNDTLFSKLERVGKLTLVNNDQDTDDDAALYDAPQPNLETILVTNQAEAAKTTIIVFAAVSIACAAAAVATGSYAVWLARSRSAHLALTDVNDILRSCQERMRQLEADVQRLPGRQA